MKTKNKAKEKKEEYSSILPEWDLSTLFKDSAEINKTKASIKNDVKTLLEEKDDLERLRLYDVLEFIQKYENIIENLHNLTNFASLTLCTDRKNKEKEAFEKETMCFAEEQFKNLGWIHSAFYNLSDEKKIEILQSSMFKEYDEWLYHNLLIPPSLSDGTRNAIAKLSFNAHSWHSLYKELTAKLNFVLDDKTYTLDEIEELAYYNKDKDIRDKALKVISDEFNRYDYVFAKSLNNIYKNEDKITQIYFDRDKNEASKEYPYDALDIDGFGNGLNREQILSIATSVTDSYVPISQRFYKLLAKLSKKESIEYNDKNMNPIDIEEKEVPWGKCVEYVLETLMNFNASMAISGVNVINANMIHAIPKEGKEIGAFCVSGDKPFIFLNYRNDTSSMITFAHEFGHAIHHLYARDVAGLLNDNTPISMSEVASTFLEKMVTNRLIADSETSDMQKLHILIQDVARQISTIHRQIAFSKFELRAFRECQKGEVTAERFTQIYSEEMERYLGFPLMDDAKFGWMAIPHLFNSPFYVRYYAFAGIITNKLWDIFLSGKYENFSNRYLNMLSNTGLENIDTLLDRFELNIDNPDFWESGITEIATELDIIEALAKKLNLL